MTTHDSYPGGLVSSVTPGSIADECGIRPGDRLVSLDGHRLRDVIDYRFYSATTELAVVFAREGVEHEVLVEKEWDEGLGIEFDNPLFDDIRRCRNNCTFCFVKNLPRGLRRSLYVKDDDYRLSFLFGNFITLSNLGGAEFDRIEEQRLSPLYVSVHATERELRNRLLAVEAPDILEQIDDLGRRRIEINAQVVLCPGVNDGPHLERTVRDLAARSRHVVSVAVVPVGLTRFYRTNAERTYRPEEAREVVRQVTEMQRQFRRELGRSFVHLGDEFYTMIGARVPPAAWYEGYPQLDNGVGLVRRLLSSWANCRRRLPASVPRPRRVGWICGTSPLATLRRLADDVNRVAGMTVEVYPVENRFFGSTVTVSGLLTGSDVVPLMQREQVDCWVLPRVMFDATGERTLDDMTLQEMGGVATAPVSVVATCQELVQVTLFGSGRCVG